MSYANHNVPEFALSKIGGKWKMPILWRLGQHEVLRYSELRKELTGISHKMLSQQLDELESDGLISRKLYPVVPPKVEYSLTEKGRVALPAINAICELNILLEPEAACKDPNES